MTLNFSLTVSRANLKIFRNFVSPSLPAVATAAALPLPRGLNSKTRLTILDHFMLEGVKALFRFTMAILYLAFQVTPPSSCEVFTTIRNTARDMYDIKLLLSIVDQIKLPKDSYFAIRRSFYMVQSSFNSDQFYMQTLPTEASKSLVTNRPLSCQQQLSKATKPPALSLISSASFIANATNSIGSQHSYQIGKMMGTMNGGGINAAGSHQFTINNSVCQDSVQRPRVLISADRSKICVQSIGKLGRSHLRIIDANTRANERALMSPLRNCILIGITNCGKNLIIARQSSKRNFRSFKEQDLTFNIHEISTEIFDGFYLEDTQQALILTHQGEIFKIDCRRCSKDNKLARANYLDDCTETLLLRDTGSSALGEHEKVKLRLSTLDSLTNLLWIYVECEGFSGPTQRNFKTAIVQKASIGKEAEAYRLPDMNERGSALLMPKTSAKFKLNNPFLGDSNGLGASATKDANNNNDDNEDKLYDSSTELNSQHWTTSKPDNHHQASPISKANFSRKIIIVDLITFDLFSAFAVHQNFGEITNLRASLVAFCQLSNPMSNQFSTRIVQIGPTGRYEQLLSFSDVADYMVSVPDSFKRKYRNQSGNRDSDLERTNQQPQQQQRYSSLRRFLTHSISLSPSRGNSIGVGFKQNDDEQSVNEDDQLGGNEPTHNNNTLTRYYRSLMKSYSSCGVDKLMSRRPAIRGPPPSESNKFHEENLSSSSCSSSCDTKLLQTKKQVP
jgi:hypothetical protein